MTDITTTTRKVSTPAGDPTEYEVLANGEVIGRVQAPYRDLGETYWTGRVDGVAAAATRVAATRKEAVAKVAARWAATTI